MIDSYADNFSHLLDSIVKYSTVVFSSAVAFATGNQLFDES
jgi:hypothetical protein